VTLKVMGPLGFDDPDGVEPVRMHIYSARNPARGKAQGRNGLQGFERSFETRTADGSRSPEANPIARRFAAHFALIVSCRAVKSPRRKSIGARDCDEQASGPDRSEMTGHPDAGANLRRAVNPMSAAGRAEGRTTRPAKPRRLESVAEHRAKATRRCMTDCERRMSEAVALDVTGRF
jgi:hypothetical protein